MEKSKRRDYFSFREVKNHFCHGISKISIMLRQKTALVLLIALCLHAKAQQETKQGFRITLKGKYSGEIIANQSTQIVINDTIKQQYTSDAKGEILISVFAGKYSIICKPEGCDNVRINGVFVGEGKTVPITISFVCQSYINSLTKRQKRKLGIK